MDKPTKVFKQEYKGHPTISIWEVDPAGNPVGKYPIVSFGIRKAAAIIKHIEDIKAAVEDNQ